MKGERLEARGEAQAAAQARIRARHSAFIIQHSPFAGGGSAGTSRSCGHTASSGAAAANVAAETANHSVRGAGGAL